MEVAEHVAFIVAFLVAFIVFGDSVRVVQNLLIGYDREHESVCYRYWTDGDSAHPQALIQRPPENHCVGQAIFETEAH